MSLDQEIAASAQLARIEFISPWRTPLPTAATHRWLKALADAWREGMALYVRAGGLSRAHGGWFG